MKQTSQTIRAMFLMALLAGVWHLTAVAGPDPKMGGQDPRVATMNAFKTVYPQTQISDQDGRITRIYGHQFGGGSSPEETAEQFRIKYAPLLGVAPGELYPVSILPNGAHTQQLMYDAGAGQYKFTLVYYSQYHEGLPVYRADLRLLVRNEPGYPLVLASSAVRDLGDYAASPSAATADPAAVQKSFLAGKPNLVNSTEPRLVIWAGKDDMQIAPAVGVEFEAYDGIPANERYRYIVDPISGQALYEENLMIDVDVTGQVNGNATENFEAEQCGAEISTVFPWARVYISSGSPQYADSTGHFVIPNGGSSPVTVTSYVRGRWFQVWNNAGAESYLTQTVTPPGPANFLHNPSNTEYTRAETNGYVHANVVRDFTLRYNPTYPTIYNQTDFPVYVNDNTGYCPGNAWYDGVSITFCRAASGYPNTAFSTVIHHEYGHHLVNVAGSGQGQYGEGMGDVMGMLITDSPLLGVGFFGDCTTPLRNADNSLQYPCSGEIHDCGQLISGCIWDTRNELYITNPSTYRDIVSNLAINAMLLHTGDLITPDITVDFLTLDDDDGDINNGTPHHTEICAGFGAHNMDCPPLNLLSFNYPNGRPEFISPNGGATMRVEVTGVGAQPQENTGVLHYNSGSGWQTVNMTQVLPNVYDATFPAFSCRTTVNYYVHVRTTGNVQVNDPQDAPASYYTTVSASGIVNLYQDDLSTNQGWTGLGGSGEWAINTANGGYGADGYGGPDPSNDHSPSSDDKVLGNDLGSGSGGDYSANLGSTYYVTSPTINCTGRTGITLAFWRWLGVEGDRYDNTYLQVYNGTSWVTIYENGSTTIDESSWSEYRYDVSTYANNNANFKIRFGLGPTDPGWEYCGWNIDDIRVYTVQCDTVQNGAIAGAVTDSQGNIANAIVHANDGAGHHGYDTTGVNGAYSFGVPPGAYSVTFTQIDHRDTTATGIVVTSGNTTTLNMQMQRLQGAVRGIVTYSGSPINNVRVILGSTGREDTTGSNGIYLITGITDGNYNISFRNPDYRDTTVSNVAITPGDTTALNVAMQQIPGYIVGTVRDSTGASLQNIFVRVNAGATMLAGSILSKDNGELPIITAVDSMYTDINGYYSSRLTAGAYNVRFTHALYRDTTIHNINVTPADTSNVSPTLQRRNRAPVITSAATATATEDVFFSYLAVASDSDGVAPSIAFSSFPAWMSVAGDTIHGTPLEGNGNTSFRIIASDGYLADTQVVAVTVVPVNDPPVITSPSSDIATEHISYSYTATATDPDNTPAISFRNYPAWLTPAGAIIFGTPPEGAQDTSFVAIASDGSLADTQAVALTVIAVNDPPVITSPPAGTAIEGETFEYLAAAYDPEGATVLVSIIDYAHWLTADSAYISGVPDINEPDTTFKVVAFDGLYADTLVVNITVVAQNRAPVITSPAAVNATEDIPFSYTATANDPDGTTPNISIINAPSWMSVAGPTISGTPLEGYADTTFTVIASDGNLADTQVALVTVIPVNDAPYITSEDTVMAMIELPFAYTATAIDPEGMNLTYSFLNYPSWLQQSGDELFGVPPSGAADTSFSVIASDGDLDDTLVAAVLIISGCDYATGDVNGSGVFNGIDVTYMVGYFKGGAAPTISCDCPPNGLLFVQGDVNGNCVFNGIDVTYSVGYFKGGAVPISCPDCPPSGFVVAKRKGVAEQTK